MAARRWRRTIAGMMLGFALSWATGDGAAWQAEPPSPPRPDAKSPLGQVVARHRAAILTLPGVVGIGPGDCAGHPSVDVFLEADTPELRQRIPSSLEGYPVRVGITGG